MMYSLNWKDVVKGVVMAVGVPAIVYLQDSLSSGVVDWNQLGKIALGAFLAYVIKNFFTDGNGKLGGQL